MHKYGFKAMLTYHQSRIVLGSQADLVLVSNKTSSAQVEPQFKKLWLAVFEFERRCSRFLPASELSGFNRAAGTRQPISPELRRVFMAAADMAHKTNGLFNPFILPALQRAGYIQSMVAAHHTDRVDDFSARVVAMHDSLEVGDDWARIPYGTALDLGGCGKGYAGDMLADLADTFPGVAGYWFSLGGDVVASGCNAEGAPWTVAIADSSQSDGHPAGTITMGTSQRFAVATSSTLYRRGVAHGKKWHHIIDPRTGSPVRTPRTTVTVSAGESLTADVMASCLFMIRDDDIAHFAQAQRLSGVLIQADDGIGTWGVIQPETAVIHSKV